MTVLRVIFGIAVIGCVVASTTFAFEFGWTRGASEVHSWTYALAAVALDVLKSSLPILAAVAWAGREWARATAAWLVFGVLTCLSLWCAYGITATQLAERVTAQVVARDNEADKKDALERAQRARAEVGAFTVTTAAMVKAADDAVTAAAAQAKAECEKRGNNCRAREADERAARATLLKAQTDQAATERATVLDAKVAAAEKALASVDKKAAATGVDPQAASMAKATGYDEELIAAISHAVLAIAIELGSGVGLWLVFGHGTPARHRETASRGVVEPMQAMTVIEEPADQVARFFAEAVRPALGQRVAAATLLAAYEVWSERRGFDPVNGTMFGRLAQWRRDRIGGRVWYLDAALSDAYANTVPVPRLIVDNARKLPRLGHMAKTI